MSRWIAGLRAAFRSVVYRRSAEDELEEEIQHHLEREIAEGLKAGLAPVEARYAALRAMGAIAKNKDECRDLRRVTVVSDFLADLRYAGRTLLRRSEEHTS